MNCINKFVNVYSYEKIWKNHLGLYKLASPCEELKVVERDKGSKSVLERIANSVY